MAASGVSRLVGQGEVSIPLGGGMVINTYHAPHFSSNILSFGLLSSNFIVAFTDDILPYNACFLIEKGTWKILWETQKKNGLDALNMNNSISNIALTTVAMNVNQNPAWEWHGKTGHLGISRYIKLSHAVESVTFFEKPSFSNSIVYLA